MKILMTRLEASRLATSIEFACRLALGQWDEIEQALLLRPDKGSWTDRQDDRMHTLGAAVAQAKRDLLGFALGQDYGIFSPEVNKRVQELFVIQKALRLTMPFGHRDPNESLALPEWQEVPIRHTLIAFDAPGIQGIAVSTGCHPSLEAPVQRLRCNDTGVTLEDTPIQPEDPDLEDGVWVLLDVPALEARALHAEFELAHEAWQCVVNTQVFHERGMVPVGIWLARHGARVAKKMPEAELQAYLARLQRPLGVFHSRQA